MVKVPCISHRRVAIANVELIGARYDAFCDRMGVRYDDVVTGDIKLLHCKWHERQHFPMIVPNAGEGLKKASLHAAAMYPRPEMVRHEVQQTKDICLREH